MGFDFQFICSPNGHTRIICRNARKAPIQNCKPINIRASLAITAACQKNDGKSRGRITHTAGRVVFIRSAAHIKDRRYSFIRKPRGRRLFVRTYPTHSPFGIATVTAVFYTSNIAHTVLHPPDLARGRGQGCGYGGSRFRAETKIKLETTLHSLRRIRSTPVNLYIVKSEFPGFMLLTRPIRLPFFFYF